MTVESSYVIAIARVSHWLKRVTTVFQPMRSKTKTNRTICTRDLSRALRELHVIAENCDWFIALNLVPRVSHLNAWGVKMRDPGNEVASRCLRLLWLVEVVALIFVFRQSFENRSKSEKKRQRERMRQSRKSRWSPISALVSETAY